MAEFFFLDLPDLKFFIQTLGLRFQSLKFFLIAQKTARIYCFISGSSFQLLMKVFVQRFLVNSIPQFKIQLASSFLLHGL